MAIFKLFETEMPFAMALKQSCFEAFPSDQKTRVQYWSTLASPGPNFYPMCRGRAITRHFLETVNFLIGWKCLKRNMSRRGKYSTATLMCGWFCESPLAFKVFLQRVDVRNKYIRINCKHAATHVGRCPCSKKSMSYLGLAKDRCSSQEREVQSVSFPRFSDLFDQNLVQEGSFST